MGGKKKGGSAHTPYEAPNTLHSKQIVKILDVLSEGPVEGLANGNTHPFKSIFFNDTPVQAENGSFNFQGFELAINDGDKDQTYLPGFDVVEKTVQVGVDVKKDTPINRTVSDPYVSSVRVTVGVKSLVEMKDNGDRLPTSVSMTVSLVKNGNYYASQMVSMHEKGTEPFYQDVTFNDLPEAPFEIRVTRNTPDSKTDKLQNATIFPSYVEIIDAKLSYQYLAMAGYKFDAMQFGSSLPRINTLLKGKIVPIPTNYDPVNRVYSGLWDGSFKMGWTDNPAWIVYEFAINKLYGGKLDPRFIDRASLYRISQFCDELVDDGYGGKERRVTFNAYYTDSKPFRERLQEMCSSFFGKAIWNGQYVTFTLDIDDDPVAVYTNANVIDGDFSYEGISNSAVITTVNVQYYDAKDGYRQKTEVVEDYDLLRRYRTNVEKVIAEGCTSRSQAHRLGRYILEKSRLRTTVNFKVGAEGLRHRPFDVIQIADNHLAGANIGGRVLDVAGDIITLDRDVENAKDSKFSYLGVIDNKIKKIELEVTDQIAPNKLKLKEAPADLRKFSAWSIARSDVKPKYYRALAISPGNDGTFSIKAIEHELGLHERLANGLQFERDPNSVWSSFPVISNSTVGNNGDEVIITWDNINADTTSLTYTVKLYKDGKLYRTYNNLAEPILKFEGLPDGEYVAEIQARNARGQLSNTLKEYFSINYTITAVTISEEIWAIRLNWQLPTIVTTDISTEIWRSETDNFNDARLRVTLPCPTSTHRDDGMSIGDHYCYWLRIVDRNGRTGEFTKPIWGKPSQDSRDILDYFQDQITTKEISSDAVDEIIEQAKKEIDFDDVVDPGDIDKIIERAKEEISFNDIATSVDIDKIIDQSLTNAKESADEIVKESGIVSNINQKVGSAELDAKLLELSKVTADRAIHAETQTNRVSIGDHYAEMILQKISEVTNSKQLASQYLSLVAQNEIAKAEFLLSQIAQATTDNAFAREIHSLTASFLENEASIKSLKETVTNEFEATAKTIDQLKANVDEAIQSEINNVNEVIAEKEEATVKSVEKLQTDINDLDHNLSAEIVLSKLSQVTGDSQLSQQVFALIAENERAKAELLLSQLAQTTDTKALVQEVLSLTAEYLENRAEVEEFRKATATEFESTARSIEKMHSEFSSEANKLNADLILSKMSQATGDAQLAQQYLSLLVQNEKAQAELILSQLAQTTKTEALVQEISALSASFLENRAEVEEFRKATATEFESTARSIEKMHSEFSSEANKLNADLILSKMSQATGDAQLAQQYLSLLVQNEKAKAELILSQLAQTTDTKALVQEIRSLTASFLDNRASIDNLQKIMVEENQSLASDITNVKASVKEQESRITQNAEAIVSTDGTVKSQYTLTTEAIKNGKKVVSGFTSVNDGETSEFLIQADKFAIVNLKNGQIVMPFIIANGKLVMDGDMIGTGTISGDKLVVGTSMKAPIIKGGRIESGHFAGGSINIGNGNFNVDSKGNLYAKSGRFEGEVFAKKIKGGIVDLVQFNDIRIDRAHIDVNRGARYYLKAEDMDYIYTLKPFLVRVSNGNVSVSVIRDDGKLIGRGVTTSGYWTASEYLIDDLSEVDIYVKKGTTRYVDINLRYHGARGSYAHIKSVNFQRIMRTEAPIRVAPIRNYGM